MDPITLGLGAVAIFVILFIFVCILLKVGRMLFKVVAILALVGVLALAATPSGRETISRHLEQWSKVVRTWSENNGLIPPKK